MFPRISYAAAKQAVSFGIPVRADFGLRSYYIRDAKLLDAYKSYGADFFDTIGGGYFVRDHVVASRMYAGLGAIRYNPVAGKYEKVG